MSDAGPARAPVEGAPELPGDGVKAGSSRRVLPFDGLRGYALILVFLYHAGYNDDVDGRLGLDMFFTLSGFLITSILLRERARSGTTNLRRFYEQRARRLLPALLTMLYAATAFGAVIHRADDFRRGFKSLPYVLLYVGNWYGVANGVESLGRWAHTWSLSVEEQFYALWPLVIILVVARWRKPRLLLVICAAGVVGSLLVRIAVVRGGGSLEHLYTGTDAVADQILVGCALAIVLGRAGPELTDRVRTVARRGLPFALAVYFYAAFLSMRWSSWNPTLRFPVAQTLIACASTILIAHVYLDRESRVSRFLSAQPFVYLGVISYSVYLWHVPVFAALREYIDPDRRVTVLVLAVLISVSVAALSDRFLERPIRERRPIVPRLDRDRRVGMAVGLAAVLALPFVYAALT